MVSTVSNYSHPILIVMALIDMSGFTRGATFITNFSFHFHLLCMLGLERTEVTSFEPPFIDLSTY